MPEAILKSDELPLTEGPPDEKGHVLVIDDEADIRESLETLLTMEGLSRGPGAERRRGAACPGVQGLRPRPAGPDDARPLRHGSSARSGANATPRRPSFSSPPTVRSRPPWTLSNPAANDYFSKPWDNEKLLIEIAPHDLRQPSGVGKPAAQARPQAAIQLPNIIGKSESACCGCWTWCRRWPPAAPRSL